MRNIICGILCLIFIAYGHSQVSIAEYSASNLNQFIDNYGKFEDFILLTAGPSGVDLNGYYISDKESNPTKWQITGASPLGPSESQIIWCSGRNEITGGGWHSNFKLTQTKGNEFIVLADPDGNIIESTAMELTLLAHSRVKMSDGSWKVNTTPLEGVNVYDGYASTPELSHPGGYYEGTQSITVNTIDTDVTIRYTLDGNEPTEDSPIYGDPLTVDRTRVVKAKAFSNNPAILPSRVAFSTILVDEENTMAVFSIAADRIQDLANGDGVLRPIGSIEYFDIDKNLAATSYGELNRHGQDSWVNPHRSLDWISRDEMGYSKSVIAKLFSYSDRTDYQRFMLRASGDDNYPAIDDQAHEGSAHVRDEYVQVLSQNGNLKLDVRALERAVVFLNGDYWGVYGLRERPADHDYTNEYYDQDKYNLHYLATWGNTWAEYGGQEAIESWEGFRDYILTNDMSDPDNYQMVRDNLQVQSLIDYMVINLACVSSDWLNYNTGWWRGLDPEGDHKKWGYILWDNDATFDYYINYSGVPNTDPDAQPCDIDEIANFMDQFFGGGGGGYGGGGGSIIEDPASCATILSGTSPYPFDDPFFIAVVNNDNYCCEFGWDDICQDQYDQFQQTGIPISDPAECPLMMNGDIPYEATDSILAQVITISPDCCEIEWSEACENLYEQIAESNSGSGGYVTNSDVGKHEKIMFKLIEENPDFNQLFYSRWADLMNTVFSCDNMLTTLDSLVAIIEPEMPRQIERWGGTVEEWKSNVDDLRDFVSQRCELIDDGLMECYDLTGPYDITLEVFPEGAGEIEFNTLDLNSFPWTGSYFGAMDNIIEANDNSGYQFVQWQSKSGNVIFPDEFTDIAKIQLTQSDTLIAIFEEASSILDLEEESSILAFPSPAHDFLTVSYQIDNTKNIRLGMYNSIGQLVYDFPQARVNQAKTYTEKIDVKALGIPSGTYYINLYANDKVETQKVTIIN